MRHLLERSTYLVLAMPGVVVAFALSYFTERYLAGFGYGTAALLVACYAIMFFPLALVGVKASLARAPVSLDEVARSLGRRRLAVLFRVTARLAGPGLVAAFCLVFLSVVPNSPPPSCSSRPGRRPWPRSSGPTRPTCPTARPRRLPSS